MPNVLFTTGPGPPKGKNDGIVSAIAAVVGAVTGSDCGTGAGGFKKGNNCGATQRRNQTVLAAQKAHTAARQVLAKHVRKGTALTAEGIAASKASAAAARALEKARSDHQIGQRETRHNKAMAARVERSTAQIKAVLTDRAHAKLQTFGELNRLGMHDDAAAISKRVDSLARGANKEELFAAVQRAGISHGATTKQALVEHLKRIGTEQNTAAKAARRPRDPSEHTDHEPGHVGYLRTDLIHADPHRFQFKIGAAAGSGSVGSLAGVRKFDHNLAGITQVWKDPRDGKVYIVNGHNRLDLAKKLGEGKLTVRFIHAKDAAQARSIGAASNIAEGRGTSIDAAKYFRDTGQTREQVEAQGIPLREKIASDGLALSKLEGKAFRRVIEGTISPERGAIIGGSELAHHQQRALVDLIDRKTGKRGEEITNGQLRELIDGVKAGPTVRKETHDLFGSSVEDESLALHRAKLASTIKDKLGKEKKLFGLVGRAKNADELARGGNQINTHESSKISRDAGTALAVFDQHKNLKGPVSKVLNEAGEAIQKGENARKVTDDAYRRILKAVQETLR